MQARDEILFDYFRQCPELEDLLVIAGREEANKTIILPQGASQKRQHDDRFDVNGDYHCDIIPYPSIYEDYHINCYRRYDVNDESLFDNVNAMNYAEVKRVCEWVEEQDNNNNFPQIGENIVSIECNPFVPQVRYVDEKNNIVCYFITIRLRYVNRTPRKTVKYEFTD